MDSKESAITSEEQCSNNLELWGLIESAENRDVYSTLATADQNADDHHQDNRFKFKRILCCCFTNYR